MVGQVVETRTEREILERGQELAQSFSLASLTPDVLSAITSREGIDVATAVLYDRVFKCPPNCDGIAKLTQLREQNSKPGPPLDATFAIAPGAFHREFPHTGADGRLLRDVAEKLGYRTALIPVSSTATLTEAAQSIHAWLNQQMNEKIVLASVSKGGADVKVALQLPGASDRFSNVVAWINVGGMLDGSPMVNWLLHRKLRTAFFRALFWWRGYNFRVISDLRYGSQTLLADALNLPPHIRLINVIGFPLTNHMSNHLSRKFRKRIAHLGPNDGGVMLADACRWPGLLYPVWGADHYMRPSWELRSLVRALLEFLRIELATTPSVGLSTAVG
jgi:hypothetical protein